MGMTEKNSGGALGINDRIQWDTIGGDHHEGTLIDIDSNVGIVRTDDGKTLAVELTADELE
jgi:hypothetical protein